MAILLSGLGGGEGRLNDLLQDHARVTTKNRAAERVKLGVRIEQSLKEVPAGNRPGLKLYKKKLLCKPIRPLPNGQHIRLAGKYLVQQHAVRFRVHVGA